MDSKTTVTSNIAKHIADVAMMKESDRQVVGSWVDPGEYQGIPMYVDVVKWCNTDNLGRQILLQQARLEVKILLESERLFNPLLTFLEAQEIAIRVEEDQTERDRLKELTRRFIGSFKFHS